MKKSRRRESTTADIDRHVLDVVAIMAEGRWRTGVSHAACMTEWSRPMHYVEKIAVAAGRHIRLSLGTDREALVGTMIAEIEGVCTLARGRRQYRTVLRGIELRAKLLHLTDGMGSSAPVPTMGAMSAKDALAFVRGMLPELEERAAREASIPALASSTG